MFRKTKGYNKESSHFTYVVFSIMPGVDNFIHEVENI